MSSCAFCKKDFTPRHSRTRFCSLRCQRAYRTNPNPTAMDIAKLSIKNLKLSCPGCHSRFLQSRSNQTYCSTKCRVSHFYFTKTKPKTAEAAKAKKLNISSRWETITLTSQELWDELEKELKGGS